MPKEYFCLNPGEYDNVDCEICGSKMDVQRNIIVAVDWGMSRGW